MLRISYAFRGEDGQVAAFTDREYDATVEDALAVMLSVERQALVEGSQTIAVVIEVL